MNHLATSKEDILAASRDLIKENGWAAVVYGLLRPDVLYQQVLFIIIMNPRQICSVIQ